MDDPAVIAGIGRFRGRTVAIIGTQKPKDNDAKEAAVRNYGMPSPEGYYKGMRVMTMAERFNFPLITFIDTIGALPTKEADERGPGGAIARSMERMVSLRVPIVANIIGEGGSGGAIALALADMVLQQENAFYNVISPESSVPILWKEFDIKKARVLMDRHKAAMAANFLPFAQENLSRGVIDGIIPEPPEGAHNDHTAAAFLLGDTIDAYLKPLEKLKTDELLKRRRKKFREMGVYKEGKSERRARTLSSILLTRNRY